MTIPDLTTPCTTPDQLHDWIHHHLGLVIPRNPVCPAHNAPFDYLCHAYFEPAGDAVVWAPRGGGKTRLGAVATLLDLLHKPGCAVRILAGSLEQSLRMWEHLRDDLETVGADAKIASKRIELPNGSTAAVLTQSQRGVRGLRIQKLRCDEVELFRPDVWEAAQLVTRSLQTPGQPAAVTGAVEAISTLHSPWGLMQRIADAAAARRTPVFKWCLMEVLQRCPAERPCGGCELWDECRGVAKKRCDGFVSIDDAIAMKRRVSTETWQAEMLCRRPSVRGSVFPSFDPDVHVRPIEPANATGATFTLAMDFGYSNPFVCLWILQDGDQTAVIDEYVQPERTMAEHLPHIEARPWGRITRVACDPAGNARNAHTGLSDVALLRKRGYRVHTRRSRIPEGLEKIRAALRPAAGEPRLFIHPRCARLIKSMRAYRYAEGGSELPVKDNEHDHAVDALRYHFVNAPTPNTLHPRRY